MRQLIPADTVDANGIAWETAGENIRKGAKEFSANDVKSIIDTMFPVGSIFCGENSLLFSVGEWKLLTGFGSYVLSGGTDEVTGDIKNGSIQGTEAGHAFILRMWKRVS